MECDPSIYSGASPPPCGPTGSWWSWISSRAGSLDSACMRERSMVPHSVGCSTDPFVERLIGSLRREYLDHMLFWTTADLEDKLLDFRTYFNNHRTHNSLEGQTRIRPRHGHQPISTRFAGNHTVEPSIRPRWLPDLSKTRARCGIRSTSAQAPNEIIRYLSSEA